jgi:rRNA large subunit m3Psi methyltransferase RlmH
MKVTLICVGKVKEKFYRDAIKEYEKRLGAYIKLNTIEISDEKVKVENDSEIALAMEKEGNNILSKIKDNQYVITLEILGKNLSSEEFASKIDNLMLTGKSDVTLVIGGSYGLSDSVKKRSDFALSFSRMTFPHQMMRVVLLEQVYRAYRIITGASYHK